MILADGSFFQRPHYSASQLLLVPRLTSAITLDHPRLFYFKTFKCRETMIAVLAGPASEHGITPVTQSRIDDACSV